MLSFIDFLNERKADPVELAQRACSTFWKKEKLR